MVQRKGFKEMRSKKLVQGKGALYRHTGAKSHPARRGDSKLRSTEDRALHVQVKLGQIEIGTDQPQVAEPQEKSKRIGTQSLKLRCPIE
jgi:hypothetical protein